MTKEVRIGQRRVGPDEPVYVIAEIGINHNGSVELAKRLIDGAVLARCDAVKFQKRTPELCVPRDQWEVMRDTPWGRMSYLAYRHRIEFDVDAYAEIDRYCEERGIAWFASCWDEEAVDFMTRFDTPCIKAASASISDLGLLAHMADAGPPVMISTGMWGSDQAASIDIGALMTLVTQIRDIERSLGDGVKQVYASEHGARSRLRRVATPVANGAYARDAGHEG